MKMFNPESGLLDYYERAKYLFAWRITLICTVVFTLLLAIYSFEMSHEFLVMCGSLSISVSILVYLRFSKNYKPVFWVYVICALLFPHFTLNFTPDITHGKEFLWMIAGVVLAFVGLGKKEGLIVILLHATGIGLFLALSINNQIENLLPRTNTMLLGDFLEICFALFCIGYLLFRYMQINELLNREVKSVNMDLMKRNKENVVLLKEVHHRVKNNLQIISSLLSLHKNELSEQNEINKFDDAINRIMTMSLIHQKLYREDSLSQIKLSDYILELANEIKGVFNEDRNIEIRVVSEVDNIDIKTLVPLGLILNELLSNSFKHAFMGDKEAKIQIEIKRLSKARFEMNYNDFGSWVEPNDEQKTGFGIELIKTLSEQLEGGFVRTGSLVTLEFENLT
jgi:two-component sensor histidine kinase